VTSFPSWSSCDPEDNRLGLRTCRRNSDARNASRWFSGASFGVFARKEAPPRLVLDDLQWLDTARSTSSSTWSRTPSAALLLVGAYRDNEVGPAHSLMRTLEAIRSAGARVQEIVLSPSGSTTLANSSPIPALPSRSTPRPLHNLVHEKTGGTSFFRDPVLHRLAEEGLLAFDQSRQPAWDKIASPRTTPTNVVDLIGRKLSGFSATTQEAVKRLACLGNIAEIATLTLVHGETEEAMDAAVRVSRPRWARLPPGWRLQVSHDRIQQAAYYLDPRRAPWPNSTCASVVC